jgi:ribosomal protein L21
MVQAEPGSKVQFGRVLAHKANGSFVAGHPYLENVRVEAEILEELKGPKLIVRTCHYSRVCSAMTPPPRTSERPRYMHA